MESMDRYAAATASKSPQSCPTLYDPIDRSPPGSAVPEILQARIMEWAAISFSNAWKWKVKVKSHSRVQLFTNPWTAAHQALPSMGFSRQEYWSGVPLPSPVIGIDLQEKKKKTVSKLQEIEWLWQMGSVRLNFFYDKPLVKTNTSFQVMRGCASPGSWEEEAQDILYLVLSWKIPWCSVAKKVMKLTY